MLALTRPDDIRLIRKNESESTTTSQPKTTSFHTKNAESFTQLHPNEINELDHLTRKTFLELWSRLQTRVCDAPCGAQLNVPLWMVTGTSDVIDDSCACSRTLRTDCLMKKLSQGRNRRPRSVVVAGSTRNSNLAGGIICGRTLSGSRKEARHWALARVRAVRESVPRAPGRAPGAEIRLVGKHRPGSASRILPKEHRPRRRSLALRVPHLAPETLLRSENPAHF